MTSNTTPSGVASASSTWAPAFDASHAFTPVVTTPWGWLAAAAGAQWIQYQFPSPVVVGSYAVTPWDAQGDVFPQRSPSAWTFLGSNDGATWTTLDSQSNQQASWVLYVPVVFSFSNVTPFTTYRLNIISNGGAPYTAIERLAVFAP